MTISSTTRQAGPYLGNDVSTAFPFAFKVFSTSDLQVVRTDPTGFELTLALTTDYTVALNANQNSNPGGTVTLLTPLATDYKLTLTSDIAELQNTDLTNQGGFYPAVITNALDKLTILIQQVSNALGRSLKFPISDGSVSTTLPTSAARSSSVLGFDTAGNVTTYGITVTTMSVVRSVSGVDFSLSVGQTVIPLVFSYTPGVRSVRVFLNGALLTPGVDFTESSSTTVTLAIPIQSTSDVIVVEAGQTTPLGSVITSGDIADNAVITSKINAGAVTSAKLAADIALTGNPTAPTPAAGDADTSIATTAFVAGAIQPTFSYVYNGDFRVWGAGTAAVASGWALSGAGATVARNTTAGQYAWGPAGLALTRVGTDCNVSQTVSNNVSYGPIASWRGKQIIAGMWVYATVASRARISISDGVTTNYSGYHPGDSTLRFLAVSMVVSTGSPTGISIGAVVDTGNTTAVFSGATLAPGATLTDSVISYTPRKCVMDFHLQAGATVAAGTTGFYHSAGADTAEANAATPVPFKGVARNMYCVSGGAPGVGQTYTYTLRKAGADTTVTATISASAVSAQDTTNEVSYNAGQNMCVRVVASAGAASTGGVGVYLEYEEVPV